MTIANVALTNTFDTWRTRSNQVFSRMNQFAVNNSALYANTLTANVSFTAKGSSTIGTNPTSVHRISGFTTINNKLTVTGNVVFSNATSSFQIPTGTTAQRTGAVTGLFRFNTTTSSFEGYGATGWGSIGGGGLSTFKLVSSTYTANTLDRVAVNTSAGAVTVNLPASPAYGDIVEFADLNRKFSNNNLTVGRNTKTIEGQSLDLLGDVNGAHFSCVYDGTTWQIITHNTTEVSLGGVLSGTSGTATFANPLAISSANVNLTGTGKTLIKTANTDVRGGSFLVTSNATFVGTQTKLRSANVDILGPGEFLVRKANTDIRGGTLLVTSNTVIGAELNVANTFVARKGSPIQGYGGNNVTLVIGDNGKYLLMANTGGMTIKVPSNASVAFPIGAEITFVRSGGNNHMAFTNAASGVTLLSDAGKKRVSGQYQAATLKKVAVNTWHLIGNLTT